MSAVRILIVEDEFIIAEDIRESLENMGYEACGMASSGTKALKIAEKEKPDLILMDIMLKGKMDGIETAGIIHSKLGISVVYLSAYADEKVLQRAKVTLPFGYLIKPFKDRELRAAIEMALYKDKIEKEQARLIRELREALEKVKILSGLIPICSNCKKIRDDKGYWNQLEQYIETYSTARFSHSMCPDCSDKLYGNEEWYKKMKEKKSNKG